MSMNAEHDAHGFLQRSEASAGNATLVQERLTQKGEP